MKAYLTSAYTKHHMLDALKTDLLKMTVGEHSSCDNPEDADVILFVEDGHFDDLRYSRLREHTLVQNYAHKCFMYNELDRPSLVLPGLYCNMPSSFFDRERQTAVPFLRTPNQFVKNIYHSTLGDSRATLFSFVGAASHRCRKAVLKLTRESTHIETKDIEPRHIETTHIEDTSVFNVWHSSEATREIEGKKFAKGMSECLFSLCPRGLGTASYRLFESMEAGRAPVIISDNWVETAGVNWDFAVRVKEKHIRDLPRLLASLEDEAIERGHAARKAWERAYAPEKMFQTVIESLAHLRNDERARGSIFLGNVRQSLISCEFQSRDTLRTWRDRLRPEPAMMRQNREVGLSKPGDVAWTLKS